MSRHLRTALSAGIAALAGPLALGAPASAAQDLPELRFSPILLANGSGTPAGTPQTVPLDSAVLDYVLLFESGALVGAQAVFVREPWVNPALALPLREARLAAGDPRAVEGSATYCTGDIKPPEAVRLQRNASGERSRFADMVRACLVDSDNDRRFDKAFFAGAAWPDDALPQAIDPISYEPKAMIPLPGARWRLVVKNEDRTRSLGALGMLSQRRVLQAQASIPGPGFSEVKTNFLANQCGMGVIGIDTGIKTDRLPRSYDFGCARVTITGNDKKAKTITFVVDRHMEPSAVSLTVSFLDIYGGTIYTLN